MRVLAFGEILWDVIENENHLGGAPFNFVAHIAKYGAESAIISKLGNDVLGIEAYARVMKFNVDLSFIQWDDEHPTGVVDVRLNHGQPEYEIKSNVAYDFIEYRKVKEKLEGQYFDVFYFGSLAQRNASSRRTLKKIMKRYYFEHVFYDVNLRKDGYSKKIVEDSLDACSILKLNVDEVDILSSLLFKEELSTLTEFCEKVARNFFIHTIIVTAGDKGCYVFREKKLSKIEGHQIKLSDAVGAGDAFSASFMFEYVTSKNAIAAAKKANKIGAFVASKKGPIPEYTDDVLSVLSLKKVLAK